MSSILNLTRPFLSQHRLVSCSGSKNLIERGVLLLFLGSGVHKWIEMLSNGEIKYARRFWRCCHRWPFSLNFIDRTSPSCTSLLDSLIIVARPFLICPIIRPTGTFKASEDRSNAPFQVAPFLSCLTCSTSRSQLGIPAKLKIYVYYLLTTGYSDELSVLKS